LNYRVKLRENLLNLIINGGYNLGRKNELNKRRNGIISFLYENLIWFGIVFAVLAWILDSLLDSLFFHEGTVIDQIFTPTNQEIVQQCSSR
jgi:hypothetical protein